MSTSDSVVRASSLPEPATLTSPILPSERIGVLDILRGIALLGMFFVHFYDEAIDAGGGFGHAYGGVVHLFFENRFFTMFAILFGVGFAIQLGRTDARGDRFPARYLRRLLALLAFGLVAEIGFGYHVLVEYAIWGVPLLLVRRWTTKAIAVTLVVCAMSFAIRDIGQSTYWTAMGNPERFEEQRAAAGKQFREARRTYRAAQSAAEYSTVVAARIRVIPAWYSQPFFFLPTGDFTMFLVGVLVLRAGLFHDPRKHRRLIIAGMVFGVASWAAVRWLFPWPLTPSTTMSLPLAVTSMWAERGLFTLLREEWLAFAYMGAILLLVAHNSAWLRRLSAFGITGRMALTNYMLQVMVLDLTFSNYAFGAHISAAYAPLAACGLFLVEVTFSRWWLSRYRYGPLEWLWRSITYGQWQALRLSEPQAASSR